MNKKIHEIKGIEENHTQNVGRFTIVHLKHSTGIEAVGIARKSDGDKDNPTMAIQLARGRAERALHTKLHRKDKRIRCVFAG